MVRYGLKLKSAQADAAVLKLLRKHFPGVSLSELKGKVQSRDYIYLSDMEKGFGDGQRRMAKLLREFDRAGLETELFEEYRDPPGPWKMASLGRDIFQNMLRRSREIDRDVLIDIEREATGAAEIDPETLADIERDVTERWTPEE